MERMSDMGIFGVVGVFTGGVMVLYRDSYQQAYGLFPRFQTIPALQK